MKSGFIQMEVSMKKLAIVFFSLAVVLFLSNASLFAQRGNGAGRGAGAGAGNDGENRGNTATTSNAGKLDKSDKSQPNTKSTTNKSATIAENIQSNPKLASKLQGMLPTGATLEQASAGFKSQGQFIAALHVSKNLNIPFDALKTKMTGPSPESLGKVIHDLRPDLSAGKANEEAKKAEKEAKEDEHTPKTT